MPVVCTLVFDYGSPEQAQTIFASVSPEDAGYVESEVDGCKITANISSKTLDSLLHTLDDYISCIQVAEKIMG